MAAMRVAIVGLALAAGMAFPAAAQEREYCPERPGLTDDPCTIAPGHVSLEVGLASWSRDSHRLQRDDAVTAAETMVRVGVTERAEIALAWSGRTWTRSRDRATGRVTHGGDGGEIALALRAKLSRDWFVAPYVAVPVDAPEDWSAGVVLPFAWDLGHDVGFAVTGEAALTPDPRGGDERVLAGSIAAGFSVPIASRLSATVELGLSRAPGDSEGVAALSFAYSPAADWQFDASATAGLTRDAPDLVLAIGVAHLF